MKRESIFAILEGKEYSLSGLVDVIMNSTNPENAALLVIGKYRHFVPTKTSLNDDRFRCFIKEHPLNLENSVIEYTYRDVESRWYDPNNENDTGSFNKDDKRILKKTKSLTKTEYCSYERWREFERKAIEDGCVPIAKEPSIITK